MDANRFERLYKEIARIGECCNVEKILLFGSRARGMNSEKSDIDLAVYGCKDIAAFKDHLDEEVWTLLTFDVIDMDHSQLQEDFIKRVNEEGVVIYDKI